ncbi:hypothetical protein XU18_5179 [Perkinsela sp. CCAP 1560/4]|nr:hypothetical protein XU18_5179 [Perkinsela sp. CCAP 1560/4]|eukprot:KNH01390.1 hypothetical protein XU18_5179 [Perkinsela sp. CCAP 1560/4]
MQWTRLSLRRRAREVTESAASAFQGEQTPRFDGLPRNSIFEGRGKELAEKVKHMSDAEWEKLSGDEKSVFLRYTRDSLRSSPAEVSEQQRRRYYETTQHRVRFNPNLITNPYQRMKCSLPFTMDTHGRKITVSEAMMEHGDDTRFEPQNAKTIEYAQIHFKQVFKDYISKRRAGLSTEAERRQIASMGQSLHHVVQSHLANMYKYADCKLHQVVKERASKRFEALKATKECIEHFLKTDGDDVHKSPRRRRASERKITSGIDVSAQKTIVEKLREQEDFLERLEVLNRLTSNKSFTHTEKDEQLEEYTDRLSSLLSLDSQQMGKIDAVQYFARLESCEPVDWAQRWYEKNLLYPLEALPEYQKLKSVIPRDTSNEEVTSETSQVAKKRIDAVVNFKKLLFSGADSDSLQRQRMKHLAFSFMQSQINRMRAKAMKYTDIDMDTEREAVARHLSAIEALGGDFANEEVVGHHKKIQEYVTQVMHRCRHKYTEERSTAGGGSDEARDAIALAVQKKDPVALKAEVDKLRLRKRAETTLRLIRVLEEDVKDDYKWHSLFDEAQRPPKLPLPEPFMYVSASSARELDDIGQADESLRKNPFEKHKASWKVTLFGTNVALPTRPILFWGTGVHTVQQALAHAADIARRKHNPPSAHSDGSDDGDGDPGDEENPWGWRENPRGIDALP